MGSGKNTTGVEFFGAVTASRSGSAITPSRSGGPHPFEERECHHPFEERGRHRHFEERVLTVDQRRTIAHRPPESAKGLTPVG